MLAQCIELKMYHLFGMFCFGGMCEDITHKEHFKLSMSKLFERK